MLNIVQNDIYIYMHNYVLNPMINSDWLKGNKIMRGQSHDILLSNPI